MQNKLNIYSLPISYLDPPGKPEVTDLTKSTVSIKWSVPLNDGGREIVGYIVERKPYSATGDGRWLKCNYTNITDTSFTITALGEGEVYEFRVIAKNADGVYSLPSESTGAVTCKAEYRKIFNFIFYTLILNVCLNWKVTMLCISTYRASCGRA